MSKPTERIYTTHVPIYGTTLKLVVADDVNAFSKRHFPNEDRGLIAFTAWIKGILHVVVPSGKRSLASLAHESVHIATEVLEHHGVKWSSKNDEPAAYLVGWFMEWVNRTVK